MVSSGLSELSFLWDGSQSGWKLVQSRKRTSQATFHFGNDGPSSREVMALRLVVPEFRNVASSAVWARVRRRETYVCESTLFGAEAEDLAARAAANGLRVEIVSRHHIGYLPFRDGRALIIEDDELANEAAEKMIAVGVHVVLLEED